MIGPRCNLSKAFLEHLVSIAHNPVSVDRLKSKVGRCTFSQIPAWDYLRLYPRLKGRGPIEARKRILQLFQIVSVSTAERPWPH